MTSISAAASIVVLTVRLRVICWKSAYFTFKVTVRPRSSFASQWRQRPAHMFQVACLLEFHVVEDAIY